MLEWTGALYIDTLGIPCGYDSPIAIVFLVTDDISNVARICSTYESYITLRDDNEVKFDAGLPLFRCL